ncbi:uncharacterized protein LOC113295838 [Papaver somniferum]|uniref:uncharacterized protein LOC113295838 n=1 Tax=Papaver somniferum TaxID=3469 RepID=UPI000E6F7288|nr:uncharacterized protein LOC113295838 [Papaver somniferum]
MIQKLIDAGDLNKYVQKAGTDDKAKQNKQVQLPEGNRTINTISCSEATGPSLTAQIRKRLRKQFEDYCELYKIDGVEVDKHEHWMDAPMIFDAKDIEEDMEDHNDPLVLTLPVAGCNIKKILIDGGSSVNVLFYDTFKRMELNDEQLMSSYYTIYGFNGAATKPLGDIILQLKGVAATYHQYLRFPTPEGVMEIKRDQVTARECQALQNHLNNEQDEQRKSRRARNKEAAKEKAIDAYLEEISGRSLAKENIVGNAEASTSITKEAEEPTK